MTRRGFTLVELMIASGISAFVLTALSLAYFMTLNYYRTILAETLQPTTARALRDRLYFRLADASGNATGMGLLSFCDGQITAYQLGGKKANGKPGNLAAVAVPAELRFETDWEAMCEIVQQSSVTNTLRFSPRGVLQGGTNNRCEMLFYLTPFGKSQPMATTDGTSVDANGERVTKSRPGERGAVL